MNPEEGLLDRYDRMVQTQIEMLEGIDRKAGMVMRICSLILGLILAGAAVVVELDRAATWSILGVVWGGIGLLFMLTSLVYAVITSVSSDVLHGPHEDLGPILGEHDVGGMDYTVHLLDGYSGAIHYNRTVIRRNAVRLGRALQSLLYGMFALSAGLVLLFVQLPVFTQLVITALTGLGAVGSGWVLTDETYLGSRGDGVV